MKFFNSQMDMHVKRLFLFFFLQILQPMKFNIAVGLHMMGHKTFVVLLVYPSFQESGLT